MVQFILKFTKLTITVLLIAISYLANAQQLEKSLLWKISGNGLEKPSYLYGTMHAVCETNIDKDVLKALDETSQLFLEIDLDDSNLQAKMMKGLIMQNNQTISSFLSEDELKKLDSFLTENVGFNSKMVDKFKPSLLTSMYLPKLMDCNFISVEDELMKISKNQNEEVFGLESIEYQMEVFDKIPYDEQIKELMRVVNEGIAKEKIELQKMLEVYKSEDIEKMLNYSINESDNKLFSNFGDELLVKRNNNWIPVMTKAMNDKPTFFGVGAAHLAGNDGVIKLLRKAGYKVEPVL